MKNGQTTVAVAQDISCVGRCSTLAAVPVLSALRAAAYLLPTALLSAHTAFEGVFRRNLTEELHQTLRRWENMGLCPDAVLVGYLGEEKQAEILLDYVKIQKSRGAKIFVDPVMGDHGRRYRGVSEGFVSGFRKLCEAADVIFPNLTEAALLLDLEGESAGTEDTVRRLLDRFPARVVLTGVRKNGKIGALAGENGRVSGAFAPMAPVACPGTGDLFSAAVTGLMLRGAPLADAARTAARFVARSLFRLDFRADTRFGAPFEEELMYLARAARRMEKRMEG